MLLANNKKDNNCKSPINKKVGFPFPKNNF
jgi:hypothetical protein